MERLLNAIKSRAAAMDQQQGQARFGIVESVNPNDQTVRVRYDEEGTLSGWLPLAVQSAGDDWGMVAMPVPGAQAFVVPDMGQMDHGVVVGFAHSTAAPATRVQGYKQDEAEPVQPGEWAIRHSSGSSLRLRNDGTFEIRGNVFITGDILATGQVRDLDGEKGTLDVLREAYLQHHHTGVRAGTELTGLTDKPVP